jgi:thiol-disulfide isomerase/thioredoxin
MPLHTETTPRPSYKNAIVFYYWKQCGPCKKFAPVFQSVIDKLQLPHVTVYLLEVMEQRELLQKYGADISSGVPHLELYDSHGKRLVYDGPNSVRVLKSTIENYLAATALPSIDTISVNPATLHLPAIVLYYKPTCPFCRILFPTFLEFAHTHATGPVTVAAVNVVTYPSARESLLPNASSATVPHIVYHQSPTVQIPFTQRRTLNKLNEFYAAHAPRSASLAFASNLTQPSNLSHRMDTAVQQLHKQTREFFGSKYEHLFAPQHSTVHMIAWRRSTQPSADKLFVLLIPNDAPKEKKQPIIVATLTGKRGGVIKARVATGVKVKALVQRKLSEGFEPAPSTDVVFHVLRDAGYTVAASSDATA